MNSEQLIVTAVTNECERNAMCFYCRILVRLTHFAVSGAPYNYLGQTVRLLSDLCPTHLDTPRTDARELLLTNVIADSG